MTPGYQKMLENCGTEGYINSWLHGAVCFQTSDLADEGSILSPFQIHNTAQEKVGEKAELVDDHTHQCTQIQNRAVINIFCFQTNLSCQQHHFCQSEISRNRPFRNTQRELERIFRGISNSGLSFSKCLSSGLRNFKAFLEWPCKATQVHDRHLTLSSFLLFLYWPCSPHSEKQPWTKEYLPVIFLSGPGQEGLTHLKQKN